MMRYLVLIFALLFSGCALNQENQMKTTLLGFDVSHKGDFDTYGRLDVQRSVYALKNGDAIVYERGKLDMDYEFIVGPRSIINAGFELKQRVTTDVSSFIDFSEGVARDGQKIYLIGSFCPQDFTLIYSTNEDIIRQILESLANEDEGIKNEVVYDFELSQNPKSALKSEWGAPMYFKYQIYARKHRSEYERR